MKGSLEKRRISIIGTGLIGGSLGLALKAAGLTEVEIVGHDRDLGAANRAQRLGAIDRAEHNLPRAVAEASLVIIATPVLTVRDVMRQIAGDLAEGAIVTDTASTKAEVMRWAEELLPSHVSFVGGHPLAGKETPGVEHAEAKLFGDRAYCICPAVNAQGEAVGAVVSLARLVGAEPLFIDPGEHDQYAAAVSHLPLLVSTALFTLLRASPAWPEMAMMASTGFRDMTRLASGDPRMSYDIFVTNREVAIHWLARMIGELRHFQGLLQDGKDEELLKAFTGAQMDRDAFLAYPPRRGEAAPLPDPRKQLVDLLVGAWMADKARRLERLPKLQEKRSSERKE